MVHALKDIWRVLAPGGVLLDLRPYSASWPVEIVARERVIRLGAVDDSLALTDDIAASKAMQQVVDDGWYVREENGTFSYDWYWDTLDDLRTHVEERWSPITLPDAVYRRGQRLLADLNGVRVRVRLHMIIGRYRKQ